MATFALTIQGKAWKLNKEELRKNFFKKETDMIPNLESLDPAKPETLPTLQNSHSWDPIYIPFFFCFKEICYLSLPTNRELINKNAEKMEGARLLSGMVLYMNLKGSFT